MELIEAKQILIANDIDILEYVDASTKSLDTLAIELASNLPKKDLTKEVDTASKLIPFINDITKCEFIKYIRGAYNGYVALPPEHKYYKIHYNDLQYIDVHGGLTLSDFAGNCAFIKNKEILSDATKIPDYYWVIGFDTAHWGDTPEKWNKEAVIKETFKLLEQL